MGHANRGQFNHKYSAWRTQPGQQTIRHINNYKCSNHCAHFNVNNLKKGGIMRKLVGMSTVALASILCVSIGQAEPQKLTADDMDAVTAGDLGLPNGRVIFAGFDNPSPKDGHPNFGRSERAVEATTGYNGPTPVGDFNEGPWSATESPAITCVGCP